MILDTRRQYVEYPVAVRVTFDYKKIYVRTGLRVAKDDFDKILKANKGTLYEVRKEQEAIYNRVVSAAKELIISLRRKTGEGGIRIPLHTRRSGHAPKDCQENRGMEQAHRQED